MLLIAYIVRPNILNLDGLQLERVTLHLEKC